VTLRRSLKRRAPALLLVLLAGGCGSAQPEGMVLFGTLDRESVSLTAPIQETVVSRPVLEGQHLEAGALVARLDDARLQAELAIDIAARDRAMAQFEELEAGTTREEISQAEAEHSGAVASAATARAELDRVQKLFQQKLIAQNELDKARTVAAEAEARKNRTASFLEEQRRGPRPEKITAARAAIAEAKARIHEVEVRLGQLELRAPADCTVEQLMFEVGERPAAGAVLAVLVPESAPYARVYVPEKAAALVSPGLISRAAVDGVAEDLEARFRFVATKAMFTPYYSLSDRERDRLAFEAKVDLLDPRARDLRSGVPVRIVVRLGGES
jgi:HlyD family secretion protein